MELETFLSTNSRRNTLNSDRLNRSPWSEQMVDTRHVETRPFALPLSQQECRPQPGYNVGCIMNTHVIQWPDLTA